jgi:hypothetical protein
MQKRKIRTYDIGVTSATTEVAEAIADRFQQSWRYWIKMNSIPCLCCKNF